MDGCPPRRRGFLPSDHRPVPRPTGQGAGRVDEGRLQARSVLLRRPGQDPGRREPRAGTPLCRDDESRQLLRPPRFLFPFPRPGPGDRGGKSLPVALLRMDAPPRRHDPHQPQGPVKGTWVRSSAAGSIWPWRPAWISFPSSSPAPTGSTAREACSSGPGGSGSPSSPRSQSPDSPGTTPGRWRTTRGPGSWKRWGSRVPSSGRPPTLSFSSWNSPRSAWLGGDGLGKGVRIS
jgi:hypothetical protein